MITLHQVLLEADAVNVDASPDRMNQSEKEERRTTDYSLNDEDETTDVTDEDDADQANTDEDAPADDAPQDDTSAEEEDPGADDTDDEDADYSAGMDGEGSDDGTDNDPGTDDAGDGGDGMDSGDSASQIENDEQLAERNKKVKSYLLLKNFIQLFTTVKGFIAKIIAMEKKNVLFSSIQNNAIDNFGRLEEVIRNYINFYYDHMSYEYNLYTYNYFIEAVKVNLEMLGRVLDKDEVEY